MPQCERVFREEPGKCLLSVKDETVRGTQTPRGSSFGDRALAEPASCPRSSDSWTPRTLLGMGSSLTLFASLSSQSHM